jgi:hypothetical protein
MLIVGLGAACAPVLSADQILQVAIQAGFPLTDGSPSTAEKMTAIALRESGGCPNAHNPGPGEDSYGLWQINVQGNPTILTRLGLSDPTALYDPATNAAAAYMLWGGNDQNLDTAWYINRPGYQDAYLAQLPAAQQAAANLLGIQAPGDSGPVLSAGLSLGGLTGGQIAMGVGAALLLGLVLFKL